MKRILISFVLLSGSCSAYAGAVVGATEFTQITNMMQLVAAYAKQVEQYTTQIKQYDAQLQDLKRNPYSSLNGNVGNIIHSVGTIMSGQNSIGGTMAQIDRNFSQKYGSDVAGTYAEKFKSWNDTSMGTLNAAMRSAGLHRDAYATDAQALQALFNRSQSSDGTVAAVQQLSALTAMQVQQSQKLGDLLASQNLAANAWMASQTSKDQAQADVTTKVMKFNVQPKPDASKYSKSTY